MSESKAEVVGYEQDGHVVTITYRRPEALNAINGAMHGQILAAAEQAQRGLGAVPGRPGRLGRHRDG